MLNVMEAVRRSLGGYGYRGWIIRTRRNDDGKWRFIASGPRHRRKNGKYVYDHVLSSYKFPTRGDALAAGRIKIDKLIRHGG